MNSLFGLLRETPLSRTMKRVKRSSTRTSKAVFSRSLSRASPTTFLPSKITLKRFLTRCASFSRDAFREMIELDKLLHSVMEKSDSFEDQQTGDIERPGKGREVTFADLCDYREYTDPVNPSGPLIQKVRVFPFPFICIVCMFSAIHPPNPSILFTTAVSQSGITLMRFKTTQPCLKRCSLARVTPPTRSSSSSRS